MDFLLEVTLFLFAAVVAVPIFQWMGFGAVLGYLVAGVIMGPSLFSVIDDVESMLRFSKIGVVLLLFVVGLELAPQRLWVMRHNIFGQGMAGVVGCAVPMGAVAWAGFGLDWQTSSIIALGLAFSSTAFAMQVLSEHNELSSLHGRSAFAMLLFKYIALLPLLAAIPLMGEGSTAVMDPQGIALAIARTLVVLVAVIVGGHYLLRPVFRTVARVGARETFTATALLVVLGVSQILKVAGMPMELGAFLAGVLLADSEYRHEIHLSIEPFKGLLMGLFFMSVGMSADLHMLAEMPGLVFGVTGAVLLFKIVILYAVGRLGGLDDKGSRALAALMPQGGELAFVLFSMAMTYGVMSEAVTDVLFAVVILTMAATPFTFLFNRRILDPMLANSDIEDRPYDAVGEDDEKPNVLICGFGGFGQMVGRLLHSAEIPFSALDANPLQVDFIRRYGHRIYYGDPARVDLLNTAGARDAQAIIVAVENAEYSMRIVDHVRRNFPTVPVYARARNRQHAWRLMDLGCRVITRETLAGSMDMGEQLLQIFGWGEDEAREAVQVFRDHDEQELRKYYAIHQEKGSRNPSDQEIIDELEGLFQSDEAESIDPDSLPHSSS